MSEHRFKLVDETTEKIFKTVMDSAYSVHTNLGPGLLESTYEKCLGIEMTKLGLDYKRQALLDIQYGDEVIKDAYRLDFLVDDRIVIELKAVEELNDIHLAQVLTYLKLGGYRLGLLVNFNVKHLRNGIKRVIK